MPVYNLEAYLEEAIESIKSQTFADWELIVVDDGSTDGSGAIADRVAATDPRIKVIHQPNGGVASARNAALAVAKGELIGFADGDDFLEPDMYAAMVEAIDRTGADMAQCGYVFEWHSHKREALPGYSTETVPHDELMLELLLNRRTEGYLWDKVFRREVVDTLFPVGIEFCEDLYVMDRWMNNVRKGVIVGQVLYHYRVRKSSAVNSNAIAPRVKRLEIEMARAEYYRRLRIAGVTDEVLTTIVMSAAVNGAKHIARYSSRPEALRAFADIKAMLESWRGAGHGCHSANKRLNRRFVRLMNNPKYFLLTMRLSRFSQISRLRKEGDRFD